MKFRLGFVSNSSNTSFCIYGVYLEKEDYELENKAGELGLYSHWGQYDGIYIGREWSSIKDNETGKQFKEPTQKLINKLIPNAKCSTHEDGWYDG